MKTETSSSSSLARRDIRIQMAAATTATLSAEAPPKSPSLSHLLGLGTGLPLDSCLLLVYADLCPWQHLNHTRSRDSILNRRSSVHLRCRPSVAAAVNLNFHSSNNGAAQKFSISPGDLWRKPNVLPRPQRSLITTRAYKDDILKLSYPVIAEKPRWWWRTLACIPYLIALQMSDTGFLIQPLLEHYQMFENLIYLVPGPINGFPPWLLLIYKHFGYKWIVKNKDLPRFIRFHTMMAMLLKTGLQLVWHTCKFFPFMDHDGMLGMHFWAVIGFCFILVLLECVRCALGGRYADIPLVSDAADTHTQSNIVSFQNPC